MLNTSGLSCSLDFRVGGLGAGRLGTGEGAGGGRRLVTCFTSAIPLVSVGLVMLEEDLESTEGVLRLNSFIGFEVLLRLLYPRLLFETEVFESELLLPVEDGLE